MRDRRAPQGAFPAGGIAPQGPGTAPQGTRGGERREETGRTRGGKAPKGAQEARGRGEGRGFRGGRLVLSIFWP